jgi:hypothetical protein
VPPPPPPPPLGRVRLATRSVRKNAPPAKSASVPPPPPLLPPPLPPPPSLVRVAARAKARCHVRCPGQSALALSGNRQKNSSDNTALDYV